MPIVAIVLRIIVGLLLVRLLLRFLAGVARGLDGAPAPRRRAAAGGGGDLVRDRVCNTFVPRAAALHARLGGHEEHFCSEACRAKALAAAGAH